VTDKQDEAPVQVIDIGELAAPCMLADIDVAERIPHRISATPEEPMRHLWVLVRVHTEPIGIVMMAMPSEGLSQSQIVDGITQALGQELRSKASEVGADWPPADLTGPLAATRPSPFLASRAALLDQAPELTVVVCTRERPAALTRCLESLTVQAYPRFSILIVDNAPVSDQTRQIVASFASGQIPINYVVEPRIGVTFARNRALQAASSEITAWIDDDEVADPFWLSELFRGFFEHPDAGAVGGIMLPAELRTLAQVRWEQYGGHHKHRGFQTATFSPHSTPWQNPLFPLPPFATGGNMALRRDAVEAIGGFDPALGTGTLSMAGEDTLAFSELLLAGGTVVYQPSAITHHFHRRSQLELRRQMFGYGVGLTAYYTSLLLTRPALIGGLVRLSPVFLREAFGRESMRSGQLPRDFPSDLRWANRRGLVAGPVRYLAARMVARRRGRQRGRASSGGRPPTG